MKYLKLGIAPLCSLWFSYLSLANWLARYPVSRGEAGVCRFGGTHWLFDPTSPGVSVFLSLVSLFRMRNTEQNQMPSAKKVVSIDLPEYNVAISMSRSDKFVYS